MLRDKPLTGTNLEVSVEIQYLSEGILDKNTVEVKWEMVILI